jgi:hypothetical protein
MVDFGPRNPTAIILDFVDLLSRRPPSPRGVFDLDDYYAQLMLYPTGRRPPNFDEVVQALHDLEARQLWGRELVTLGQAMQILQCDKLVLLARVNAYELYGLMTPSEWLFSRRRVQELRDLDMMRKWLTPAALAAFEEPA